MEDYGYYHKKSSRDGKLRKSLLVRIVDIIILILTGMCTLLLAAAYLARYISPEEVWIFAFPGLIFPVLYVCELIFALWWVVRWKRYALLPIFMLVIGIGAAGRFYQPDFRKRYGEQSPSSSDIVVMSYNVRLFSSRFAAGNNSTSKLIAGLINDNNVDIICFQEMNDLSSPEIDKYLPAFKYRRRFPYADNATQTAGIGIYSRYPIIDAGVLPSSDSERNFSMWADVRVQRDTVRVFNNHLNSTHINADDIDYLSSLRSGGVLHGARVSEIVDKLRENYCRRAPQAETVAEAVKASPYPTVVCGDFNDTPASYAYYQIASEMKDAFVEKGRGAHGTYGRFFNMFRIDYIFISEELDVTGYYSFSDVYSDHMPVAASFVFAGK